VLETKRDVGWVLTSPALQIKILSLLLFSRNSCAHARTLDSEERSQCSSSALPGERIPERAPVAFGISRAVRKSVAPVAARAQAVSMPIPEDQPVIRMVLSGSLSSRPSSLIIWRVVGWASPGRWGGVWAAA
jgi:hypothetical protein